MKNDIQPKYEAVTVVCNGCGAVIETRSTKESINIEVCSKCHPFYTGKQRAASAKGRIDKFNKKFGM
ncbi:MAG: 50S ribosomal protein L31 [Cellulosilyticum sp.]|nr:50S ribosomal protein L31 [Cellulosilyticum sp.]MBP3888759.1 50S ribosomal protein L31 [Cellulosilyticum sp.]MBQ1275126.1 50S ribosomal protein L31 [Cellulosilyticum sp.]MEE1073729.1 50S ribosomal protein L31 [Cellulosilyticum sp.]